MCKRIVILVMLLGVLAAGGARAAAEPALELTVERVDGADGRKVYQIASRATVAAAPAAVWRVLTDYNRMAEFVPDLKSVGIVSRKGNKVIIEQLGAANFLFISHPIRLTVQAHEQAPNRIDVTLIEGDMKVYRCSWELSPAAAGGTIVHYSASIEPTFYVPGMMGASLVRKDIAKMMAAVVLRIDREQ
jgi:ribosome-associated toxin RatA of RatAB toxin-antitoxin module